MLDEASDGVRGFERRDDALLVGEEERGVESGLVGDCGVAGTTLVGEPGVLRADGGIIETCGDGMSGGDLTVGVLQNVCIGALKNAGAGSGIALVGTEACGVFSQFTSAAASFNAHHFHGSIAEKGVEQADGVGTAANAGVEVGGKTAFGDENLFAGFAADHGLKIAKH